MIKESELNREIPDYLNYSWEYFFRILGNDGVLNYQEKCLVLVLLLYVPGLVITTLTEAVLKFISTGWGFFLSNILIGIVVWLLISFLRKANTKISQVSKIISPPKNKPKQWSDWKKRMSNYSRFFHTGHPSLWYYFHVFATAICSFVVCKFFVLKRGLIDWVQNNPFNELYCLTWFVVLGFIAGACLFYIFSGFWMIRKYCKDVISQEEVMPLDPDHTGGLRELGRLALDLDLAVAVPSLAFLIYLPQKQSFLTMELLISLSILYCLLLIFVFFISLSPAHDDMINAKTGYLLKIHGEYRERHQRLLDKLSTEEQLEPRDFDELQGLYHLYDRVESMAVWPLDYRTLLRFLVTSVIPLIASVITISWP